MFVTADKLRVLVRVDLDCARAQVAAQGHVTSKSVHGLYAVMKRANSLTAGMALAVLRCTKAFRRIQGRGSGHRVVLQSGC